VPSAEILYQQGSQLNGIKKVFDNEHLLYGCEEQFIALLNPSLKEDF